MSSSITSAVPDADTLKNPFAELNASTQICAVYGFPVRHSASPAMHNAAFEALGINARYLACEVDPAVLPAALAGAKAMGFAGINLTVPHKLMALPHMDHLDHSAREWGAVNTVVFETQEGGRWTPLLQRASKEAPAAVRARGCNTDAEGLITALSEDLGFSSLAGRKILILGAGGAGRVAALRLAKEKPSALWLQNRTVEKARELAKEVAGRGFEGRIEIGYPNEDIDLVLNATSLGLKEQDSLPFDPQAFDLKRARNCYDMIYKPARTRFLQEASIAGCRCANGLGMLLHQGARAFELWTDRKAPIEVMRRALRGKIYGGADV